LTTKILALVDALGNLVGFRLMPGQRGETTGVAALIEGITFSAFLGDKAYDADWLRSYLRDHGIEAVIPPRAKRLTPATYDAEKYKWRHLIENFFQKLKEFKRIAMRACKTDTSFQAMIYIAAAVIRSR
jgi:transposase